MTNREWVELADRLTRECYDAGFISHNAAGEALEFLIRFWYEAVKSGDRATVLINDLNGVIEILQDVEKDLMKELPNVLEEHAEL